MATSETTNLQLVKYGAGTDNFIRTDYNGNLDKIDTFAGNTNEAIDNLTVQSFGTAQNPITSLDVLPPNSRGVCVMNAAVAPTGANGTTLSFQRYGNATGSSSTLLVSRPGGSKIWVNYFASGAWQGWLEFASTDAVTRMLGDVSLKYFTIAAGNTETITYVNYAIVSTGRSGVNRTSIIDYEGNVIDLTQASSISITATAHTSIAIKNNRSSGNIHGIAIFH